MYKKLFNEEAYLPVINKLGIKKEEYFRYIQQIIDIFSEKWIKENFKGQKIKKSKKGECYNSAEYSLQQQSPFIDIYYHPIPSILANPQIGLVPLMLCEFLMFGRDLKDVSSLTNINYIKNRLINFNEYFGSFFEIQVLAEFVRANLSPAINSSGHDFTFRINHAKILAEICCMDTSNEMQIYFRLEKIVTHDFLHRFPGSIEVKLESLNIQDAEFKRGLKEIRKQVKDNSTEYYGSNFSIRVNPNDLKRTSRIFLSNRQYEDILYDRIYTKLGKKRKQLPSNSTSIIIIDVRGITIGYSYNKSTEIKKMASLWLKTITNSCKHFLENSDRIKAVLLWYPKSFLKSSGDLMDHKLDPVQIIIVGEHSLITTKLKKVLNAKLEI